MSDLEVSLDPAHGGAFLKALDLRFDKVSPSEVRAHLDATEEHHTPWGITHGGVYTAVIETVATIGASAALGESGGYAVGVNNQTDFLRPHRVGRLDVSASPVQQGKTLQLWAVQITDGDGKLIAQGQVRLFNRTR